MPNPINKPVRKHELGRMLDAEVRIIRQAQAGDPQAFQKIVETYQRPVMATLYRFIGNKYPNELEDFVQDIFLKVFKAIHGFDFERHTKFSTWLYTFVKNYAIDIAKKKKLSTVSIHPKDTDDSKGLVLTSKQRAPLQKLGQQELAQAIEAAIDSLPEEQKEVFILREYENLNYNEISEIVNCSEGTVKSRLYRARDALRIKLAPYLRDGSLRALHIRKQQNEL